MKKIFLSLFVLVALIVCPLVVHAEENYCYNLRASVGENATSIGINYHSSVTGTKVWFGTDPTLTTHTEYTPDEHVFEKGLVNNDPQTGFDARYVCQKSIEGLELNTQYYYAVAYDNEIKSTINTFKTAGTTKTTFGVLCDTQAWGSNFDTCNELVNSLVSINNQINFFMIAGDIIDRGGYEAQWESFDSRMVTLNQQYLQATVPGNHELYHSSEGSYIDASIYNEYYNNPKNGIQQRMNSSYYFVYNDILFVMLDTMSRSSGKNYYEEQVAWFKQVAENVRHNFLIVVSHPGCYSAGAYDGDAQTMRGHWSKTFEEYGVDLAISGHEHIYLRTKPLYEGRVDTTKGVTYLIGGCAGPKKYSGKDNPELFDKLLEANDTNGGQFCASIVEVVGDTLTLKYYDRLGNLRDSFSIKTKNQVSEDFNIDEFLEGINVTYNPKTHYNYVNWPGNAYGHLKNVTVTMEHLGRSKTQYIGPASNEMSVGNGDPVRDYTYTCVFTDYEGNEYTKVVEVINNTDSLRPKDMVLSIDEVEEGKYVAKATYDDNGNEQVYMYLFVGDKKFTFEDDNTVEFDVLPTEDNVKVDLLYVFFNNMGESEFDKENMELTIKLLPKAPEEKDPEDDPGNTPGENNPGDNGNAKKKGCKRNAGAYITTSIITSVALAAIVIKKRH